MSTAIGQPLSELTWTALQARVARLEKDLRRAKRSAQVLRESRKTQVAVISTLRLRVKCREARIVALEELLEEARVGQRENA